MRYLAILVLIGLLIIQGAAPTEAARLHVPEGTPLLLHATDDVVSNRIRSGQVLDFQVVDAVRTDDGIVIAAGAMAHVSVAYSRGSGVGFGGEMLLTVMDVQAVDGAWVPLRAVPQSGDGRSRIIPDTSFEPVAAGFPSGRNLRLPAEAGVCAWLDADLEVDTGRAPASSQTEPSSSRGRRSVYVPSGLALTVRPVADVSSRDVKAGDAVAFTTAAPLVIDGVPVVAEGAAARGTVLLSRKARRPNTGGLLVISIDSVQAVDGAPIRLSSSNTGRGGSNKVYTVAISLVVPIVGLAVEGREAVVRASKELPVYVMIGRTVLSSAP